MFKKILAVSLAAALVLGLATCASAEKTISDATNNETCRLDGGNFFCDTKKAGLDPTTVYGATFTISVDEAALAEAGLGGGIIFNGPEDVSCGWDQGEWGNEGSGKSYTMVKVSDGVYTITRLESEAKLNAEEGASGSWAEVALSAWWGPDFSVTQVDLLGKDGGVLYTTGSSAQPTGSTAPVTAVAVLALVSGAAVVVCSKRKAY